MYKKLVGANLIKGSFFCEQYRSECLNMQEVWKDIDAHAKQWIRDAGEHLMASMKKALIIETKSNAADLVTNMDREIEQFLIGKIKETFPHHNILGEEGYGDEVTSSDGVVWLIDPIDGTMNFVHQKEFCDFNWDL